MQNVKYNSDVSREWSEISDTDARVVEPRASLGVGYTPVKKMN